MKEDKDKDTKRASRKASRRASRRASKSVSQSASRRSSRAASQESVVTDKTKDKEDHNHPKENDPNDTTTGVNPPKKENSGNCCTACCLGCFGTRQLTSKENRQSYIRTTLVELAIYLVYLTVCSIIVYGAISSTDYYYTKVLTELFLETPFDDDSEKSFRTSNNVIDFWKFTETVLLSGLYWEEWYDDPVLQKPVGPLDQGILYENRILGLPRLRQIRVTKTPCPMAQATRGLQGECYPEYDEDYEQKQPYTTPTPIGTAWKYHTEDELKGRGYWGEVETYSGAGSYLLLSKKRKGTQDLMSELKEKLWISRATRVVFLEFTVYNANINMFCVIKLAWEFPPTGGLVTSWSIRAVRLFRYISTMDYVVLVCEIIFVIFTIYYTIQEIIEMCKLGLKEYLRDVWSYLDVVILVISYVCICFSIYRINLIATTIKPLLTNDLAFADFSFLSFWETQFCNAIAICLFFAWVKIFKYISFNRTMSQLSTTLSRCAKDIGGFAIMFFIVFFAFAQLGYLLFGTQVSDFSSFQDAIFTLLLLILGEFDFKSIEAANRVLGPIYFLSYIFFVFFVLLNMFLAIINDTYSEVKTELQAQRNEFQISDYLKQKFYFVGGAFRRGDAKPEGARPHNDATLDGKITSGELRTHLMNAEYSENEVNLFLARYELDKDHTLDEEETGKVIENLEGRNSSTESEKGKGDLNNDQALDRKEIQQIEKRVTTMEASLTKLLSKMDKIIVKIDNNADIMV